jgi:F0F1-type ATP synthase membrane subunit c/vacuolar-type H+-ATPase subunit K
VTATRSWSAAKAGLPVAAAAAGAAIGWRLTGGVAAIAVMAVPLAAANGYSKSYSP